MCKGIILFPHVTFSLKQTVLEKRVRNYENVQTFFFFFFFSINNKKVFI